MLRLCDAMGLEGELANEEIGIMLMFKKVTVGVVLGVGVGILAALIFLVGSGAGETGGKAAVLATVMGFSLTFILAVTAESARYAWGRGLLLSALLCFAMPAATLVVSAASRIVHSGKVAAIAGRVESAVGNALTGTPLTLVAAAAAIALGIVFLVGAYVSLREA